MSYQANAAAHHGSVLPTPLRVGVDTFIAQTYTYFSASLLGMAVVGAFSYAYLPASSYSTLSLADFAIWIACGCYGWRRPLSVVFPLFTVLTGLFIGQLAYYQGDVFLSATVLTLFAFGGLSAFVHITKRDFSYLRGALCLSFFVMLGAALLLLFFQVPVLQLVLAAFGVLVFGGWILYDTSEIIHRANPSLTPGLAAFELILDLVGLHRWLMAFLNLADSD